jgi:hypothetical protein
MAFELKITGKKDLPFLVKQWKAQCTKVFENDFHYFDLKIKLCLSSFLRRNYI